MVLVDANVLLDILTSDPKWFQWSAGRMERARDQSRDLCRTDSGISQGGGA